MSDKQRELDIQRERDANEALHRHAEAIADAVGPIWHWGDGNGGHVVKVVFDALEKKGLVAALSPFRERSQTSDSMRRKSLKTATVLAVIERHGFMCHYCHRILEPHAVTIDHRVPVAKGGTDDIDNLVPACRPCNSSKGAR